MNELFGKKRVFVGSSTEGRPLADKVILELENKGFSPLPWYDFFKLERPPLQELEHLTLQVDGAVLVATSDDKVIIRERQWRQARDNVLFEYGLFAGTIGRGKCSLLVPDEANFRIPSDFLGVACFERYLVDNSQVAISTMVESLATAISKPPREDSVQSRGRRLLTLLGWIRDESFRLVQDWDNQHGSEIVSDRIVAVSAFVREDIDILNLRQEYDAVERVILDAAKQFPKNMADSRASDMLFYALVNGDVRPNRDVLEGLLDFLREPPHFRDSGPHGPCESCRRFLQRGRSRSDYDSFYYQHGFRWPYDHREDIHSVWAAGVAEAATVFPAKALFPLKKWSEFFLPKLNESIVTFERRLHEEIFGRL